MTPGPRLRRYAGWVERRRWAIVCASIAFAVVATLVAAGLAVRADFSYLVPQSAKSVQDLRAISARARILGTAMVVVESDDPVARRRAAVALRDRILALGPGEVSSVTFDRGVERRYGWDHRWLFADLTDLEAARDGLTAEVAHAKLAANPLYVPLDDPEPAATGAQKPSATAALRKKLRDAEATRDDPQELVGPDGRVQMMIVHTGFASGDSARDHDLCDRLDVIVAQVAAESPHVDIGVAGDIPISLAEHDAILDGMLRAIAVTVVLVLLALGWYFRSALAIGALSWSLLVGTVATFAFAQLTLGYLNLATAFLSSIVIGNGINAGILVTARYLEELRAGRDGAEALANALAGTIAGTLAAALTAAVAYASLVITVFRGFRHFGIIGGVGILLCWASAYIVLPAALAIGRQLRMRPRHEAPLGRWLARLVPGNLRAVAMVMVTLSVAGAIGAGAYILGDPFEANFRNLRSESAQISAEQRWVHAIDEAFGQGLDAGFVVAVPRREDTAPLEARLREVDRGKPERERLFSQIVSLDDLLPKDQARKLAVLAEIRTLLSSPDLEALDDADRAEALRLRPPDDLRPLVDTDIPDALASPFIEVDGSRGKLLLATPGKGYEIWDAHDTVRFSNNVRALGLPADHHLGGASFVFADVLEAVLSDGPRATLVAALGAILMVLIVIGRNRYSLITIACGASGTVLMIAAAALLGLRINFLDFVALPITIGIGIEYAVNIVSRVRQDGLDHRSEVLASTGGAVFLCSYTTIVGYGSLLISQNLGIRSFGVAAMLGELTCLVSALLLAPALLSVLGRPGQKSVIPSSK